MKSPHEALVDAYLLKTYDRNQGAVDDYLRRHTAMELNPYVDCSDNTCRWAREYADEVIETLGAQGLGIVPVFEIPTEAYDELVKRLDEPARPNEKLRALMQERRPDKPAREVIWGTLHEAFELDWPADKIADNVIWNLDTAGYEIKEKP